MEPWYSMSLGDGMLAAMPQAELEAAFQRAFTAAGGPSNMAVFTRHESEGRLHCEVMAYFSPAAWDLAKAFGAQPCEKPARAELSLLAGDKRAWLALFPESDR
ncbi:MAG: hypothetical protein HYZ21_06500 [Chloroflexi bacterium]|nr:hypothetical protein [Chloroflexota bacterium]